MKFEWDEHKNLENIRKHGIDFRDVVEVFDHPMLVVLDTRRDYGEDRWFGIGLMRNIITVVIFVEWEDEETIRIISARKAKRYESEEYHRRVPH
jgi:uncharacterized DUF497 family protein